MATPVDELEGILRSGADPSDSPKVGSPCASRGLKAELQDLFVQALTLCEEGEELDIESLCAGRPECVEPLRALLEQDRRWAELHQGSIEPADRTGALVADRYRLEGTLGAGAMGTVYRAFDTQLGRLVAVKVLNAPFLDQREAFERFDREAKALAAVNHPNVVSVFDRGRLPGGAFLVTEMLEGLTLAEFLTEARSVPRVERGPLAHSRFGGPAEGEQPYLRWIVSFARDVARALSALHAGGMTHRDVKPSNVFLRSDGRAVLLDLGVAASRSTATLTRAGQALGTPAFMPPELMSGGDRDDPRVDIYGLGAALYNAATFQLPYEGTPSEVFAALATRDPVSPARLDSELNRDFLAIVDCAMERDPNNRYASADLLEEDLGAFLEHRPIRARRIPAWKRELERLLRSRAVRAAIGLFTVAILAMALRSVWKARAEARWNTYAQAWAELPGNLTLGVPELRSWRNPEHRRSMEGTLTQAVEASGGAVQPLMTRAAFRMDQGRLEEALEDLQDLNHRLSSPFGTELVRQFRQVREGTREFLEEAALPASSTPEERFVVAFLRRRVDPYADVRDLLDPATVEAFPPAEELLLLHDVLDQQFPDLVQRALRLDEYYGVRSASTRHWVSVALLQEQRYAAVAEELEAYLAKVPHAYGSRINLARAYWASGEYGLAEDQLIAALEIQPARLRTHDSLIRLRLDAGAFDAAEESILAAPFGSDSSGKAQRELLLAELDAERALASHGDGNSARAVELASRALERFRAAVELGASDEIPRKVLAQSLVNGNRANFCAGMFDLLTEDPLHLRRLEILQSQIPEKLDAKEAALLQTFIESLAHRARHELHP